MSKQPARRGFAAISSERQREIASLGGKAVPDEKRSFSRDPELARQAGRKGGQKIPAKSRSFAQNTELAAQAGRKGGLVAQRRRREKIQ
jgi:general stress protein YciG